MNIVIPTKENICAVIITFHPDNDFALRLAKLKNQVSQVLIVDNASKPECKEMLNKLIDNKHIHFIANSKNLGVAEALNQGLKWAKEHHYHWCLTLDQDSVVKESMIQTFVDEFSKMDNLDKIAVIGSNHISAHNQMISSSYDDRSTKGWIEKKTMITSGSLMSVDLFEKIGPFRSDYFIDAVDTEYSMRAGKKGYRILFILKPLFTHSMGARKTLFYLPSWLKHFNFTTNYPPFRWFFFTRNHAMLSFEYLFIDPLWALEHILRLTAAIIKMSLFEKNRLKKLHFVLLGLLDSFKMDTSRDLTPKGNDS